MSIKSAVSDSGIPSKIIPFSPEILTNTSHSDAFKDVLCCRSEANSNSYKYVQLHEKFKALIVQIENAVPEIKKTIGEIEDVVVSKEVQCFDAGYRAGMADLMTVLTFNELQITNTLVADFAAMDEQREAAKLCLSNKNIVSIKFKGEKVIRHKKIEQERR